MTQSLRDTSATYTSVIDQLTRDCVAKGLDILQPLQAGWYNECVNENHRIDDFQKPQSLVVLIGNTSRIWAHFVTALKQQDELLKNPNPFDSYVEEAINTSRRALKMNSSVRWAHRPQPDHIAIQKMAEVSGLAWRSSANLSVHPVYGPWIGLRAAIVFPITGPPTRPLPPPACDACPAACAKVMDECSHDRGDWKYQLAVRDACPIGQRYRYSDSQIAYHYTKSRDVLHAATVHQADSID